jgi:hypothetical protein
MKNKNEGCRIRETKKGGKRDELLVFFYPIPMKNSGEMINRMTVLQSSRYRLISS